MLPLRDCSTCALDAYSFSPCTLAERIRDRSTRERICSILARAQAGAAGALPVADNACIRACVRCVLLRIVVLYAIRCTLHVATSRGLWPALAMRRDRPVRRAARRPAVLSLVRRRTSATAGASRTV